MNASSLTSTLLQQLQQGPALQQVSKTLGVDSNQASQAIQSALPLLMGALGNNASNPQGAQSLLNALQRDHSTVSAAAPGAASGGLDLGGLLGAVLGGGGGQATNGAGILGHVFGGQTPQAAQLLGQKTGLDSGRSNQLLALLAPIVMSYLAQRFAQQGNAGQLSQELGQEAQASGMAGGGLAGLLDQDGDGKFGIGDVMKIGSGLFGKRP
ncbi:DUF937 domain-containing protein [Stenotrophomonas sp. CFBP 13718]|uniref:DUF937 domain-containing protein n=1 Tax=Stenotrophomonas sp. CFBP 13718 TaxID=2775304 RepID=UPI0017843683|nr:DUF937 domain-containing protein [Stenotrophomonas sp. CFBP 13718]MBD8696886.1 DUF937 domain-containing protein [Stenotrophomonas sp. CFBP 13718]